MGLKNQDFLVLIFLLILTYLVLGNWRGATALLTAGQQAGVSTIKTLQGRG